ncbi:MAG: hypothetical protein K2N90_10785, partial [Lachnospiraceae bacterium]|nr:hypothetical protein [Lachnospiraceae bacterium]
EISNINIRKTNIKKNQIPFEKEAYNINHPNGHKYTVIAKQLWYNHSENRIYRGKKWIGKSKGDKSVK